MSIISYAVKCQRRRLMSSCSRVVEHIDAPPLPSRHWGNHKNDNEKLLFLLARMQSTQTHSLEAPNTHFLSPSSSQTGRWRRGDKNDRMCKYFPAASEVAAEWARPLPRCHNGNTWKRLAGANVSPASGVNRTWQQAFTSTRSQFPLNAALWCRGGRKNGNHSAPLM